MNHKWILTVGTLVAFAAIATLLVASPSNVPSPPGLIEGNGSSVVPKQTAIESGLSALETRLAALETRLATLETQTGKLGNETESLRNSSIHQRRQLAAIDAKFDQVDKSVSNHMEILASVSQQYGSQYAPRIESNMAIAGFREDLQKAVHDVMKKSEVYIKNNTRATQLMVVNERTDLTYVLPPGGEARAKGLPAGNVSTRLNGGSIVNWSVGPPHYYQEMLIQER